MIRTLRVHNLAVIDELELEFAPGLNVITGETGAGKSLLVGAIGLLRGQRASAEAIRSGADEAGVEAIVEGPELLERARALGLAEEGASELLVARSITRGGRGRVHVNGSLATAAILGQLFEDALEVTSQGEHQRLLRPEVQVELLDRYGGLEPVCDELARHYQRWTALDRQIRERHSRAAELARREDQLRFEIEQLDAADPRPGELESLEAERGRLAHVDRLAQHTGAALEVLEGERGVRDRVAELEARLREAARLDPSLTRARAALDRARLELEEATAELSGYAAELEADPARLERVEARRAELEQLRARYGESVEAMLAYRDRAREELEQIAGGDARTAELEAECEALGRDLERVADALGKGRREAAARLESEVTSELRALDLRRALFEVHFDALEPSGGAPSGPGGRERARFLLSANPGESTRRLRDAASGGELARLLLSLRNVLRDADRGRVLLFDEVDAGIGGRTAQRVGERLRRLGGRHQVLCITHLPQIAALGEAHTRLVKRVRRGRTATQAERLDGDARVDEIARMASGGRPTAATRAHARELLERE